MKSLIFISLFSLSSMADTFEYTIDGMSCAGCKNMIKSAVCSLPGIKTCAVEIGSMKLTAEDGKTLDQAAITQALDDLNKKNKEDYKIAKATKVDEVKTATTDAKSATAETKTSTTKKADKK